MNNFINYSPTARLV